MEIVNIKVSSLRPYEKNAKKHDQTQIDNVAESIKQFGMVQPIVVDKDNVVIIGHCRLEACKKLKYKEVPCVMADTLTEEQVAKLRLLDNKLNESDWDYDLIREEIADLSFDEFDIDWNIPVDLKFDGKSNNKLSDKFIAPPFTVLDTKQGYWNDRKRQWKILGIKSELGRADDLLGGLKQLSENSGAKLAGTSVFDPVLCEVMYKWFNVDGGAIYDCFAGGSVRGIVAEKLGYKYFGIELRNEQVEANYKNAEEIGVNPTWYCDDSQNVDKYIDDDSVDMVFSCPPYFDLEQYSDDEKDLSNMDWEDFKTVYKNIITKSLNKLKNDRFAVFVVGEVRDKKGFYRGFVDYTKQCFADNGVPLYNDMILLENISTGALRAGKQFSAFRKPVKCFQNVLVFYKGDVKKIKENYGEVEVQNIEDYITEEED